MNTKTLNFGEAPIMGPLRFVGPLALSVAVCAALAIYGKLFGLNGLHWVAKPLTTFVLVLAIWHNGDNSRWYTRAILAGMVISMFGDAALVREDWFLPGLLLFVLAHVAYLVGLSHRIRFGKRFAPFVLVGLFAALLVQTLWPKLPVAMQLPFVAYAVVLSLMVAQAWVCYLERGDRLARYAAIGATVFLLSDALLAINRFLLPLPLAALWILATYWIAQTLLAISVNRSDGSR